MGSATAEWLLNFGATGIFLLLIITGIVVPGWVHKNTERALEKSQDALAIERQRNADLQHLASLGAKAMSALAEVAQEQRERGGVS